MFDFFRRHRQDDARGERERDAADDDMRRRQQPSGAESWRALSRRDQAQRRDEPGYGGAGYFGSSDSGGQSFNGAQRLYPGDPGYRAHPTRPDMPARAGAIRPHGPRNYQRADARIRDDVCERLAMHDAIDVSEVSVDVEGGVVKLSGTVADRYARRAIEDIAEAVFGVQDVENHIRVQRGDALNPSERTLNLS